MTKKYSNKPNYRLMTPIGEGDKTKWREVGAGWINSDESISIVLGACVNLDFTRKLVLYPAVDKSSKEKANTSHLSTGG